VSVEVDPALLRGEGEESPRWLGGVENPRAYRLVRKLGAGGMAEVMLATYTNTAGCGRTVAIKLVREDFAAHPEFRELFASEAKLASTLTHPNIVAVLDYACDVEQRPFLVMEYVGGVDLWTALKHPRPFPISVAAFVAAEVLRGLGYAHALPGAQEIRGVVHRDLSPQNILLSWDGAVKIADFGIARALVRSSVSGTVSGKPAYMSPEQTRGDRLDGRSDLYSAGVVLWEMLTGRRLFGRGRIKEIFTEIALGIVPRPSEIRSEVPAALDCFVGKLLAVDRDDRYRHADEALTDLLACECMAFDGTRELSEALAERFHRPPPGSDGVSVMAEDRVTFDTTGITPTCRTETEEGSEGPSVEELTAPPKAPAERGWPFDGPAVPAASVEWSVLRANDSGAEDAAPVSRGEGDSANDAATTIYAAAPRRPWRHQQLGLVTGAVAVLLLSIAWLFHLAQERVAPSFPSPASRKMPEQGEPALPLPEPTVSELPNPGREGSGGAVSAAAASVPTASPVALPQREGAPTSRRATKSRSVQPKPAKVKRSGIVDLYLGPAGSR
jgi:eukaryotic-like serine/threonine-protein kinase